MRYARIDTDPASIYEVHRGPETGADYLLPTPGAAWPPAAGVALVSREKSDRGRVAEVSYVPAMLSGMTSPQPLAAPSASPYDAAVTYLAACHRCATGVSEPFQSEADRDAYAVAHAQRFGHVVHVAIDGIDGEDFLHVAAMLRVLDGGLWRWLCTAPGCEHWNGPYDTGLIALESWRAHQRAERVEP